MAHRFGQQALTVLLPVRAGEEARLERRLDAERAGISARFAGVRSLHCGRLVLIPRAEGAGKDALLFETSFDGEVAAHCAELTERAGSELLGLFEHCESSGRDRSVEGMLRLGSRRTGAFFSAHRGLSVERIERDAALREAFRGFVRAAAARSESPLAIVAAARARLAPDFGLDSVSGSDGVAGRAGAGRGTNRAISAAALCGLAPWLVRSALHDGLDLLKALWTDARLDRSGVEARLDRIAALDVAGTQRAFTHVVAIKPGRFRRRALAAALRCVDAWFWQARPSALGSSHFARWVELGDGRLAFLSQHDQSLEAELGSFVERLSFVMNLVWSHTRDFPAGFSALFGGVRDEPRFKAWAQVKQLPTQLSYCAYPSLSVSEVRRGAELRGILSETLAPSSARRALELV